MHHISFSSFKDWNKCPFLFKVKHIDKVFSFTGNVYTCYGTAMHKICENYMKHVFPKNQELFEKENVITFFNEYYKKECQKNISLQEAQKVELSEKDILLTGQSYEDYLQYIKENFSNTHEVFSTEYMIENEIDFCNTDIKFKGIIDLILKEKQNDKYIIIDYKTTLYGWDKYQRSDKITAYQLVIYKYFFSKANNIPLENIDIFFMLIKKSAKPGNHIEMLKITSGKKKIQNCIDLFKRFLLSVKNKNFIKNKLNCEKCEYKIECRKV